MTRLCEIINLDATAWGYALQITGLEVRAPSRRRRLGRLSSTLPCTSWILVQQLHASCSPSIWLCGWENSVSAKRETSWPCYKMVWCFWILSVIFGITFYFLIFLIHSRVIDTLIPKLWAHPSYSFYTRNLCVVFFFSSLNIVGFFFWVLFSYFPSIPAPASRTTLALPEKVSGNICTSV